ncbi:hypothetical protein Acr_29g0010880 [Actinidia rufa]|uniref:Uncharacterized protein n=1 Tax=Actinidia rufa TaxID=165716 RepID=A0A7J0HFL5_9ERIC|nr:hypothetical protein Acr_29g0010880 [Actinidia rufa]
MRKACLDKMAYVQDSNAAEQMQGTSGVVPECVMVWTVNKDCHQHVIGQSYEKETLVRVSQFVGGLADPRLALALAWLGSSHVEGCSSRQLGELCIRTLVYAGNIPGTLVLRLEWTIVGLHMWQS